MELETLNIVNTIARDTDFGVGVLLLLLLMFWAIYCNACVTYVCVTYK